MPAESVGHLSVRALRSKCKQMNVAVRGSKGELLARLSSLGFDVTPPPRSDADVKPRSTCGRCHACGQRIQASRTGKTSNGLKKKDLKRLVVNERRSRKKPERYSPSVSELDDDESGDWNGISLDDEFLEEFADWNGISLDDESVEESNDFVVEISDSAEE